MLTPKKIAELAGTYFNYNQATAKAFVAQRIDYTCGAILLFLSFAIQMFSLFLIDQRQELFFQTLLRAILFLLLYAVLSVTLILVFRMLFGAYLTRSVNQELQKP